MFVLWQCNGFENQPFLSQAGQVFPPVTGKKVETGHLVAQFSTKKKQPILNPYTYKQRKEKTILQDLIQMLVASSS